jgi:cytochrome c biogenesis protein CcdA
MKYNFYVWLSVSLTFYFCVCLVLGLSGLYELNWVAFNLILIVMVVFLGLINLIRIKEDADEQELKEAVGK